MIVVDTNILAYLFLTSERSLEAEQVFDKDSHWLAPRLWRSEFRNTLTLYLRKQILSLGEVLALMEQVEMLVQGREYEVPSFAILQLVQAHECSAYAAEFVVLAEELDVPLVTADKQLLRLFPDRAFSPHRFVSGRQG